MKMETTRFYYARIAVQLLLVKQNNLSFRKTIFFYIRKNTNFIIIWLNARAAFNSFREFDGGRPA